MWLRLYSLASSNSIKKNLKVIVVDNLRKPTQEKVGISGLMIFRAVAEPPNSGKSAKFGRNHIKYVSVQHIWTYFSYRGYLLAVNLQIYLGTGWNFVTGACKQRPETTRCRLCCEKLGTSHDVKGFAIGSLMLVWSGQNWSISSEICHENNHKIDPFYRLLFGEVCPEDSREIPPKSADFSAKFDFFFRDLSEALVFVRSFTPNTAATTSWDYFMNRFF